MSSPSNSLVPEVAADCACLLGEGPVWSAAEEQLYWVDIKRPAIWRKGIAGPATSWTPPVSVTALAPRSAGGLIAATARGFAFVDVDAGTLRPIADPEADRPGNRFNDGKVDPRGRFWAGTMDDAEQDATGALYRLDPALAWSRIDDDYRVPNGPAFSPDGSLLYHSDSALRRVYRFPLRDDGSVGDRQVFLQFEANDGHPDGMTTDADGCLWIAFWDGWCVRRFAPDGRPLERIEMPVQRPTSCVFGGSALDRLFVTSARVGLSDDALHSQPHAGDLFVLAPPTGGLAPTCFAG